MILTKSRVVVSSEYNELKSVQFNPMLTRITYSDYMDWQRLFSKFFISYILLFFFLHIYSS